MQQQNHPNASRLVPLSNYDVTELKLENGQLALHGLGALPPTAQSKSTWSRSRACDTLESIVDQATCHKRDPNIIRHDQTQASISSMVASSGGTWTDSSVQVPPVQGWIRKRTRSDSGLFENNFSSKTTSIHEEHADPSSCASPRASVGLCRDTDTTISTLVSFKSPPSLKTKCTDEDSACHGGLKNRDDGRETTKGGESSRSHSTRPGRAAAVHNQSERKRRDRINQKMKTLHRLVPNASKTDKASMLDEVIKYLQQLQAHVQMMHSMRNFMPNGHMNMNMMLPLEIQQQQQQQHLHQMSLLAHMGMGTGTGTHIHPTPIVAAASPSFMPPFMMPPLMPPHPPPQAKPEPTGTNNCSDPLPDPYCALLTQQSMNMDLFNRMATLYRQQVTPATAASSSPSQSNHVQRN